MVENNKSRSQNKFIHIKFLSIRERVKYKIIVIEKINTNSTIVDTLIKNMSPIKFNSHLERREKINYTL